MKKWLHLIILLSVLPALGKDGNFTPLINQTDSVGLKTGLWFEPHPDWIGYYKNGVLDGAALVTSTDINGDRYTALMAFFRQGEPQGSFVMFHPNGVISFILTKLLPNTDFKEAQVVGYSNDFNFKYQGYGMEFYPSGKLQAEGWYILGEEIEIDLERVGVWKFYYEDGTVEEVNFSGSNVETKHSR